MVVTATMPIIVERSMWWPSQIGVATLRLSARLGRSRNSPGATGDRNEMGVADGETGAAPKWTATYYLIANTSSNTRGRDGDAPE